MINTLSAGITVYKDYYVKATYNAYCVAVGEYANGRLAIKEDPVTVDPIVLVMKRKLISTP